MEPKPAATVIVARPGRSGVEILVLRRGPGTTFGPGFVTFPGGSIDPEDETLGERWFRGPDQAARAAVIRELAEETGIVVTAGGPRRLDPSEDVIEAISSAPPSREDLPQLARWIAPEFLEIRFDARFFAVAARTGIDATPDGIENDRAWWARPADVLAQHELGSSLMWPTYNMLKELAGCRSVDEVLALRAEQVPPPIKGP